METVIMGSKEVATTTKAATPEVVTEEKLLEWLNYSGMASKLQDNEKKHFLEVAMAYGLNPFKREIYCVPYTNRKTGERTLSLIVGYEVYLKRAERSGLMNGWHVEIQGSRKDQTLKAVVTIHRKDWDHPFVHEAYWFEYHQNTHFWNTKFLTMIKKVAIAQAFRMCFPEQLGGMDYIEEELPEEKTKMATVVEGEVNDVAPKEEGNPVDVRGYDYEDPFLETQEENVKSIFQGRQEAVASGEAEDFVPQKEELVIY